MAFKPRFDVEIRIDAAAGDMSWLAEGTAQYGEGANRGYVDLRETKWSDVDSALAVETKIIDECIEAAKNEQEFLKLFGEAEQTFSGDDGDEEKDINDGLDCWFLDLGTAAATLALNAARCCTIMSCNGHQTGHPYIAFWARPAHLELLKQASKAAGIGLINGLL